MANPMKTSQAGNAILPNTFQHPNIFIDRLMFYLTPEENVVLTYAVRRILGFQKNISSRRDNISLSQFVDGIKSADGSQLSKGCGLGTNAIRRALATLQEFNILLPTTEKADARRGQEYWLQDNENAIAWDLLEERLTKKLERERRRTHKARSVVGQQAQGSVPQQPRESVGQQARVLSDNNTKPRETQGNPEGGAPPAPNFEDMTVAQAYKVPTLKMFVAATGWLPADVLWEQVHNTITEHGLTKEKIKAAAVQWVGRGYNRRNVDGILEWAVKGIPENGRKPKEATPAPVELSPEELEAKREKVRQMVLGGTR